MDYRTVLLLLAVGSNLGLAFFIFFKDSRSKVNVLFSFLLISISFWSFVLAMFYASDNILQASFWVNLSGVFALFISLSFYYFCRNFPFRLKSISFYIDFLNILVFLLVLILLMRFGLWRVLAFNKSLGHPSVVNPIGYIPFTCYFVFYISLSFIELFKKLTSSSSYQRRLIKIVFTSTFLAAIFGTFFNLLLPIISFQFVWLGPLFTMVMVFIIVRYLFIKTPE